ncbi:DUF2181 domain-containing protein [Myxococcus sp. CA051A]|uniref:FAM151A/B family protein n=1 Tax=Myxococcus sp. CA051A TaxID=2741739 RepID=UPI00157BB2CE|nr:DUF2181 domain-containing protein [Myxococcus sp. CA051A]NTX63664.1 DUF2181 domain-containing protein [Myxococcus sp. CA051A]
MPFEHGGRIGPRVVPLPKPSPPPPAPEAKAVAPATVAKGHSQVDSFQATTASAKSAESPAPVDNTWSGTQPLSEARNAHRTNTKEQFEDALNSGANWFEGDVRKEINKDSPEMRHDKNHEDGDNLTLNEWLTMGKESGRGLKLDIKEADQMPAVLDELEKVGISEDRLMLNLGFEDMQEWGPKIRERFPNAILAINPPTGGDVKGTDAQKMVDLAKELGGPATFVVRHDKLTDEAIKTFLPAGSPAAGTISVWGDSKDPVKAAEDLKARGVNGMIDIAGPHGNSWGDRADAVKNWFKTGWDKFL